MNKPGEIPVYLFGYLIFTIMLFVLDFNKPIWIYPVEKIINDWNFSGSEFEHTQNEKIFLLIESKTDIHNPYPSQYMDGTVRNWSVFLYGTKLIALPPNFVRMLKELKDQNEI